MQQLICGLDEAGCGPLAGPVVAGAVILPDGFDCTILNDSKKMTVKRRQAANKVILREACWALGVVDEKTIDKINILQSRLLAMKIAFAQMASKLHEWAGNACGMAEIAMTEIEAIADGTFCPELPCLVRCEPKADGKYHAVMAASIIAKEERDRIMQEMDALYPQYGYARHKGYPTKEHIRILHQIGPSPIQRLSFNYH